MTKKSDEDSIHPSETAYDKAIKRMEEREACILNTPTMQVTASVAEQIRVQQAPLIQALQPLQDAIQPYHNLMEQNSLGLAAATASLSSVAQTLVPDDAMSSMTGTLNAVATAMQPYRDINPFNSDVLAALEAATITPELREFRTQFEGNVQAMGSGLSAISDYIGGLTSQWDNAHALNDVLERSIAAQNFAVVRIASKFILQKISNNPSLNSVHQYTNQSTIQPYHHPPRGAHLSRANAPAEAPGPGCSEDQARQDETILHD